MNQLLKHLMNIKIGRNNWNNNLLVELIFTITGGIYLFLFLFFGYLNKGWIIGADSQYYFATGRSLYFDHDFSFDNELLKLTPHPEHISHHKITKTGRLANQFPIGYSLFCQPFFILSDIVTFTFNKISNKKIVRDGYRGFFKFIVPSGTLFYSAIGFLVLFKFLTLFYDRILSTISLVTTLFSASVLWYTVGQVAMVHAHSFTFVSLLIYLSRSLFKQDIIDIRGLNYGIYF